MMPETRSRYIVGVDLGTTNSALAYIDTLASDRAPRILSLVQWEAEGALIEAEMLPSFLWLLPKNEWKKGLYRLPFAPAEDLPDSVVGRFAREQAGLTPDRVIHSAKSWLCHGGVDREARILPWHSDDVIGSERRSPIEVSSAYLRHLREVWDKAFAAVNSEYRLDNQTVIITVPASFDEVAQQLTIQAAIEAGYNRENLRLLEEPQAAFYYWLSRHGGEKEALTNQRLHEVLPGMAQGPRQVLICDVGGGTTDFSLFEVTAQQQAAPSIVRLAVSEHLLLGGDNIDLSLAHLLEERLVGAGQRLSSRQWAQLVVECRRLKERALSEESRDHTAKSSDEFFVSVAGESSSLFASTLSAAISRAEIIDYVVSGFLPACAGSDRPQEQKGGLRELGLPYAQDSAITRHLAGFLRGRRIDAVLYTGGTLKPEFIRTRLTESLRSWQEGELAELDNDSMDLAVALGAAYAGYARRMQREIRGGYPRSVYVEVERQGSHALVCLAPKGLESGERVKIAHLGLKVLTEKPVRFQLFTSLTRDQDKAGDIVSLTDGIFHPLPPLHTQLSLGDPGQRRLEPRPIDVSLEVMLTETGLLELYCVHESPDSDKRWPLQFNVRAHVEEGAFEMATSSLSKIQADKARQAKERIENLYGKKKLKEAAPDNPKYLLRDLEQVFGMPRDEWDTAFLRSLWPTLEQGLTRRGRSVGHETTWLYLAGFALRPGYGYELDEWRVAELWRVYDMGMSFPKERQVEEQWWIMWRRVAAGLNKEQQEKIFDKIFPMLRKGEASSPETWMLVGSLERVDMQKKVRLGNQIIQQIVSGKKAQLDQKIWAIARIASRVPLYGGPEVIVRPKFVGEWFRQLRAVNGRERVYQKLNLFYSQAGRVIADREFDLPEDLRQEFLTRMAECGASEEQMAVVRNFVAVDFEARSRLFGEALPSGLILK